MKQVFRLGGWDAKPQNMNITHTSHTENNEARERGRETFISIFRGFAFWFHCGLENKAKWRGYCCKALSGSMTNAVKLVNRFSESNSPTSMNKRVKWKMGIGLFY